MMGIRRSRATARGAPPQGPWTSNNPGGGATTDVVFTAAPKVIIAANTPDPPGTCFLQFTETVLAPSKNPAGFIEQVVSYDMAQCDNGQLDSGGFQTGEVSVTIPTVDFDCYQADSTFSSSGHTLTDVFGTFTNVTVGSSQRLCAPAAKVPPDPPGAGNRTSGRLCDHDTPQEEGEGCGGKQPSVRFLHS